VCELITIFRCFLGEKKRVPVYIPPPLPEDEDHIFETIQKGINFDKYDQINVECTGHDALKEHDTIRRFLCHLVFVLCHTTIVSKPTS